MIARILSACISAMFLAAPALADPVFVSVPAAEAENTELLPGFTLANPAPITPRDAEARQARLKPVIPTPSKAKEQTEALRVGGTTSAQAPVSIAELTRALKNDPDLIYEFVRNNIETHPIWGLQKGALGTLIEGQGTAWDQADLMVKLLRQAGYTADYVQGQVDLTPAQMTSFYGIPTTAGCSAGNYTIRGGIPTQYATVGNTCAGALQLVRMSHVWVRVNIGGTNYVFDPAHKPHTVKTGINVTSATGYNATTFINNASVGSTVTTHYVQNMNRTNVRSNLTTYSNNLVNYIRSNVPAGDLDDVVGGKLITPSFAAANLRQTAIPYKTVGSTETVYIDVPAALTATLQVQYQGINQTLRSDELYGKRLSVFFNGSNQPELRLDGTLLATGTATTPGTSTPITFTATHNAYTLQNQTFSQSIIGGGSYIISSGWGPTSRGLVKVFHQKLEDAKAAGGSDTSEAVLGSSLATVGADWLAQTTMTAHVADRLAGTNTYFHHQVGIAGLNGSPYVDLQGNVLGILHESGDATKQLAAFHSIVAHSSIIESNAVQEVTGTSAVSTVKLIDMAVANGNRIYNATSANYLSTVKPNLTLCSAYDATFQAAVNAGARLILPSRCDITENSWSGTGWFDIRTTNVANMISGGLHGGNGTITQTAGQVIIGTWLNAMVLGPTNAALWVEGRAFSMEPIDLFNGSYFYDHDDIKLGTGEFPYALGFKKHYNSGGRLTDGPLGFGWTHNFAATAKMRTDGFQGRGEDSPIDAATSIVGLLVSIDLFSDTAKPLNKLVIDTIAQRWAGDQQLNNAVFVRQGPQGELFVKLADGSYNAPPGSAAKLVKNGDGTFAYTTADKVQLNFDTFGNIASRVHPSGVRVNFAYDVPGGKLTSVTNSLGRSLTLGYTGARITSVSDGNGRSVAYGYDGSGNLSTFTDATLKATTFQYDLVGRMTRMFYPANPANPFMINVYDSLGRVQTQTGATGKVWNYFFAGPRSEEVAPDNARLIHYFNGNGRTLATLDNLLVGDPLASGRLITNKLDGQERVTEVSYPEGNKLRLAYDDASCASADKRCTHNIRERRQVAKSGSGLADIVQSFTYESSFNQLLTATDAKLKVTNYQYSASGQLVSVTLPAPTIGGTRPQTTYGYTSFAGIGGYPAFSLPTSETKKIDATTTTVTTTAYNAANRYVPLTRAVDPTGLNLVTTLAHDAVGNLTSVNGPRTDVVDVTGYAFDSERRQTQITDAASRLTRLFYDANGNLVRASRQAPGAQWQAVCRLYSFSDQVTQERGPALVADDQTCPGTTGTITITDKAYDDQDRLLRVTERQTAAQGGDRVTETYYFPDDKIKQVKRAVGAGTAQNYATYTYTPNGLTLTLTDAKGQLTTYLYDGVDRLQALRYPSKTTVGTSAACNIPSYVAGDDCEVYGYDVNNNRISRRARSGASLSYTFDDINRLTLKSRPDAANNVTYGYDLLGRLKQVYQDTSVVQRHPVAITYDKANRLTQVVEDGWTSSFLYDQAGNRTRFTYPYQGVSGSPTNDGFYLTYDYDLLNRLTNIRERGAATGIGVLANYSYDELSRSTLVNFGNGTSRTVAYAQDSKIAGLTLNLDGAGTANDNGYTIGYSQLSQLNQVVTTNPAHQWAGWYDVSRPYSANGLNQYATSGANTLTYDDNGNLIGDQTWTFSYSVENELAVATAAGLTLAYRYDGLGRLDRRTRNTDTPVEYRYDGQSLVADHAPGVSPQARRYVHGVGVDAPIVQYDRQANGTYVRSWYAADFKGSIVATSNDAAVSLAIYSYGPFGEPNANAGPALRYTGQMIDADSGLYYYRARWYSPYLGRFLQTDPIGTQADMNLYAYVGNDPLNLNDPSGLDPVINAYPQPNGAIQVVRSDNGVITGNVLRVTETLSNGTVIGPARTNEQGLGFLLDLSSQEQNRTVFLLSGERSPIENRLVGGALNSPHLTSNGGRAMDIAIYGYSGRETALAAFALGAFNRVNEYSMSAHVDFIATGNQGYFMSVDGIDWVHQPNMKK